MKSVVISSGHGLYVRGASGYLDEVNEARKVVDRVGQLLTDAGVPHKTFHDNTSTSQGQNLNTIVAYHNSQVRDRDISVHFNANATTSSPMGTEVLYKTNDGKAIATPVCAAIVKAGSFKNRGAKLRTDLKFLNSTTKPAALIETCFVDSSADTELYRANFEAICVAIAESIAEVSIATTPPPVEPPVEPEPEPEPPPVITGNNRMDIVISGHGDGQVRINDDLVHDGNPANRVDMTLSHSGDVIVTINGEDFHNPAPPDTHWEDYPTIKKGSSGAAVVTCQTCLSLPADGIFGSQTDAAVRVFQREQGLVDDGIVGPATWEAMDKVYGLPPYEPPTVTDQVNIKASVFGGSNDPNNSAYAPYDMITDREMSVALPWSFPEPRPPVWVRNRANDKMMSGCKIRDKGPWLIDDNYWELGTRPVAEVCAQTNTPLPRGKYKGTVPNGAGIDLTPALARHLGISGMGQVDWGFAASGQMTV